MYAGHRSALTPDFIDPLLPRSIRKLISHIFRRQYFKKSGYVRVLKRSVFINPVHMLNRQVIPLPECSLPVGGAGELRVCVTYSPERLSVRIYGLG